MLCGVPAVSATLFPSINTMKSRSELRADLDSKGSSRSRRSSVITSFRLALAAASSLTFEPTWSQPLNGYFFLFKFYESRCVPELHLQEMSIAPKQTCGYCVCEGVARC